MPRQFNIAVMSTILIARAKKVGPNKAVKPHLVQDGFVSKNGPIVHLYLVLMFDDQPDHLD